MIIPAICCWKQTHNNYIIMIVYFSNQAIHFYNGIILSWLALDKCGHTLNYEPCMQGYSQYI